MDIGFNTLKQSSTVTLPMELIFSCILPKLPAKSLVRFKCVSKSFLTEISSSKFNASFLEANHRLLIVPGKRHTFRIYELDSPQSPPTICPHPMPSMWNKLLASCESYLLIGPKNSNPGPEVLILLNPITQFYRILPDVLFEVSGRSVDDWYGVCHCLDDEFNDDFKVVRFGKYARPHYSYLTEVNIYSSRTNLWRRIECGMTAGQWMDTPVLVQTHLLVMMFYDVYDSSTRIRCFDFKAERWSSDVLLPDTISSFVCSSSIGEGHYYYLGVLDGKLRFSWYDKNKATYTVWVMKKYGDKSSWVKLTSLPAQGMNKVYHPIAYRKESSHELLCISRFTDKYYWYNLRDKQFTQSEFENDSYLSFAYICKGNLSNFPGGQPICSSS